jgi:hypothetical protein
MAKSNFEFMGFRVLESIDSPLSPSGRFPWFDATCSGLEKLFTNHVEKCQDFFPCLGGTVFFRQPFQDPFNFRIRSRIVVERNILDGIAQYDYGLCRVVCDDLCTSRFIFRGLKEGHISGNVRCVPSCHHMPMRPHQLTAWSSLLFGKDIGEYPSTFTDKFGLRSIPHRFFNEPEFVFGRGGFGIARAQEESDKEGDAEFCFQWS